MLRPLETTGRRLAALALIASAAAASAQAGSSQEGWPTPPSAASQGAFGVIQATTNNRDELIATWRKPSPGVRLKVTTKARLGQTLTTFITFRGCRPDRHGNCDLTARYEIQDPSGKVIAHPTLPVWANRPHPQDGVISLGEDTLNLGFKLTDPPGAYVVRVAVTDHVAHVTLHTHQVLQVTE